MRSFDTASRLLPVLAILIAATAWGSVWYPYRLLNEAGIGGGLASILTYLPGLLVLWWLNARRSVAWWPLWRGLLFLALATGWTNLSYVLAVLHGEILRVMLLFYLAPVWTLLLAWWMLGERPDRRGYVVFVLALAGAWVMLDVGHGLPLPTNAGEWFGLGSGIGFALANILSRQLAVVPEGVRSLWIFVGVLVVSAPIALYELGLPTAAASVAAIPDEWAWIGVIAVTLFLATHAVQFGLARISPNRVIVILLFELIVVAVTGVWWANEVISMNEWIGGVMILAATGVTAIGGVKGGADDPVH
jgi:drug/metabolite transporter (DMT)-like permease